MTTAVVFINSFLLGMLASFSPCLFPILPTFVAFLTASEDGKKRNGIATSILVILGMMTVFIIAGIVYSSVISQIAPKYLLFRTTQGIILIILGILLTLQFSFNLNLFNRLNAVADSIIQKMNNEFVVAYLIGLLFTLLAAPCAIIVFVTVFVLIAGETLLTTILVMIVFSLGAGIPFLLVGGLVPRFNNIIIENNKQLQYILSIASGLLIGGVGIYLTLDGLRIV